MKTFNETLKINNTKRKLFETFVLMSRNGIDPMRFVDWYTLDGIEKQNQGLLVEASEEWLISEGWWDNIKAGANAVGRGIANVATGNVAGGAPGAPGTPHAGGHEGKPGEEGKPADPMAGHMKNAHTALDSLSKRMGNSKGLAQELGGQQFQSMVANLMYMIQNNQVVQQGDPATATAAPTAAPTAHPPTAKPAAEPHDQFGAGPEIGPHSESNGFTNFTGKIRLRNEIKTGLRELQEYNVNPVKFVDWYIEEGQYLNENAVGDWFGRQWAGLGGAFSGKGYSAAGQEWQQGKDKKRDDEAVQQAINTLWQFEREMKAANVNFTPDFAKTLNDVRNGLHKRAGMAAQAGEEAGKKDGEAKPPDPAVDPAADPGVKPAAASGGTASDSSMADTMKQHNQPVKNNVVGEEMDKIAKGDFSAFGDNAEEMKAEWEQIKNLPNDDPKKHERFAYLMRYFNHPRQNEVKHLLGNLFSEVRSPFYAYLKRRA